MPDTEPVVVRREDYRPPNFTIDAVRLEFRLDPVRTRVHSTLTLRRLAVGPLILDGGELELDSVELDGHKLSPGEYEVNDRALIIDGLADQATLVVVTIVNPSANTALEGLYRSSGTYCTQCEAEGFRRITYYLDRPDVLAVFDVHIEADRDECPVLLSNGNRVSGEHLPDGRLRVHWHDPFPKPSYLFALVGGRLAERHQCIETASGREVDLFIHVEEHNLEQCEFAMQSLIAAIRWEEAVYGLEFDLERYSIVAVDDFNMGAMENKGLNIFNSRYVLAHPDTATDADYLGVESVIAHEYFHNWTGNRVTCRDWFQLSLKEGLTVFRDQCFTSDRHSAVVKRIEDVQLLRARQFAEDASPMAHPIRPDSYMEINNFYTLTVYEKGAEVIRMLHTLMGDDTWHRGIALYLQRHDGTAATCDDFLDAMVDASGLDLEQFRLWYSTAGTPVLDIEEDWNEQSGQYRLHVHQHTPDTPGQSDKPPLHIPLTVGLLDPVSGAVTLAESLGRSTGDGRIVNITERRQVIDFGCHQRRPIPSLLRNFSAPVKLHMSCDDESLAFLMQHDSDPFNRWEAGQRLAERLIEAALDNQVVSSSPAFECYSASLFETLGDTTLDPAFRAEMIALPSLETLAEGQAIIDYTELDRARRRVIKSLLTSRPALFDELIDSSEARPSQPGQSNDAARADTRESERLVIGHRRLANSALALLGVLDQQHWSARALRRYRAADNMSDRMAALQLLCHGDGKERLDALNDFRDRYKGHRLVMDKWFAVQAMAHRDQVLDDVQQLLVHPDYEPGNPNRVQSLLGRFSASNPVGFHKEGDSAYRLLAEQIVATDARNPQLAARLVAPLMRWRRFTNEAAKAMREALRGIDASPGLSVDVRELVCRSLHSPRSEGS